MEGTIRQRSAGSCEIQVFLGRDVNGKRMRKTETVRGKRADAQRRLREILSELDRGITPTKTRYKLSEWLDKWMEEKIVPKGKQKTIDRYGDDIRLHIKPALGHIELTKLSPVQVQEFETNLLKSGKAAKGVQLVHCVLSGAMKHAQRLELVARNPVSLVSPPTAPKTEAYSPQVEQVRALLILAEELEHPLWVCIHLIAYTGMRRGEALALEWKHVDLEKRQILVCQSLVVSKGGVLLETPKTESSWRVVDIDIRTAEILKTHRSQQRALAAKLGTQAPEKLFSRADQASWTHPNNVMNAVRSLGKKAGCPDITLRSLRHFHATVTLQAGQSPVVVSKRIGHSNPKITMEVYAHVLPGWQQDAAEAFADAMQPSA
ncbi:MAG: site-specific integrase [Chloroflexi bacterium]|nr:site-specific integrase [Chloroflexota bacterium]